MSCGKPLTTGDIRKLTGWSLIKIRSLIDSGKLPAVNTSTGDRPFYHVPAEAWEKFINPNAGMPKNSTPSKKVKRKRMDANVEKVFGGSK